MLAEVEAPLVNGIRDLVHHMFGVQFDVSNWRRLQLPGPLGGVSLHLPGSRNFSAYLATWVNTSGRLRKLAQALGRPIIDIPDTGQAVNARRELESKGILVSATESVSFTDGAAGEHARGPWVNDVSSDCLFKQPVLLDRSTYPSPTACNRLEPRIQRGLDALEATHFSIIG